MAIRNAQLYYCYYDRGGWRRLTVGTHFEHIKRQHHVGDNREPALLYTTLNTSGICSYVNLIEIPKSSQKLFEKQMKCKNKLMQSQDHFKQPHPNCRDNRRPLYWMGGQSEGNRKIIIPEGGGRLNFTLLQWDLTKCKPLSI